MYVSILYSRLYHYEKRLFPVSLENNTCALSMCAVLFTSHRTRTNALRSDFGPYAISPQNRPQIHRYGETKGFAHAQISVRLELPY